MKVSIITVCFNAEKTIHKTIQSVIGQTIKEFEWLVIDGQSTDNTLQIIKDEIKRIDNANHKVSVISEPDNGIYNAMNKGVNKASGEWIIFMNSGDTFYDKYVLESISSKLNDNADFIYGDTWVVGDFEERIQKSGTPKELPHKMPFCHQSIIVKRVLLQRHPFDEKYKICADMKFCYECVLEDVEFQYIPIVISKYDCTGVSSINQLKATKERFLLLKEYGLDNTHEKINYSYRVFTIRFKNKVKSLLSPEMVLTIRKKKAKASKRRS